MSVEIEITNAIKRFGETTVIHGIDLSVRKGEFFTLLGPSGCGKTTLLRMIAGFNTIEGGEFAFNGKVINDYDPAKRNIGMVFQNYAIFPHLTVRKNVAFGLQNRKLPKEEIEKRTEEFMQLVHVAEYANRLPERLSGGQQQRVALARALVIQPDVLLMDEPLSNLDAKLRVEMRSVIKEIQNEIGITTVYVTHDQEEAMAVSDSIAVMKEGVIQHVGTPKDIYQRPANEFVATFIGRTNMLDADLEVINEVYTLHFPCGTATVVENIRPEFTTSQAVHVSIRPEEFVLQEPSETGLNGVIVDNIFLGLHTHYQVELTSGERVEIIQESSLDSIIPKGTKISLGVKIDKINIFSADGEQNLVVGVINDKEEEIQ